MRPRTGPFPMGIPPPLALAKSSFASDVLFLSFFTAFAVGLVTAFAWFAARRRFPRVSRALVLLGVALVVSSFVPQPRVWSEDETSGLLTGNATFHVGAEQAFAPAMRGGEARVEAEGDGMAVSLTCPQRCEFLLGDVRVPRDGLEVRLEGGPFLLRVLHVECRLLPVTLWLFLGGANGCVPCEETEFLTAKGDGSVQRLPGATRPLC